MLHKYKYKYSISKYVLLILVCLLLFISGFQIPKISILTNFLLLVLAIVDNLMGWQLFSLNKSLLKQTKFIQPLIILTLFCIIYWNIMNDYSFLLDEGGFLYVSQIVQIISFYIIGFSINYSRLPGYPYNSIIVMSSLVTSPVIFSWLSILKTLRIEPSLLDSRRYLHYWSDQELTATMAGDFFSLGLLYIVIVLYGYKKEYKLLYLFFSLISAIIVFFSFNGTVLLQNRLAMITTAISFIAIGFLLELKSKLIFITVPLFTGLFALVSIGINIIQEASSTLLSQLGVFNNRFINGGIESGRSDNYQVALEKIWQYPFGGREFNLPESEWVHNLWLDVAYDAGLLPMFLLMLYFIQHIKIFFKLLNSDLPKIVIVYFSTIGIGIVFNMSFGPILQSSSFEFGMVCFFLGIITRLSGVCHSKAH